MLFKISCALLLLLPTTAYAQNVHVTLEGEVAQALGPKNVALVERELETEFTKQSQMLLGDTDLATYLDNSANAQSSVGKGLGTDYASGPDGLMVGVAVGVSAVAGDEALDVMAEGIDSPVPVGAGAQLSLMLGYNFETFDLPELTVFAHGAALPATLSQYGGDFYNFGGNLQFRFLDPRGTDAAKWGGLALTAGVQVSRMSLSIAEEDVMYDTMVEGIRIQSDSNGQVTLVQRAVTIPIELTSSLHFLYFLSLFGGAALDINFATADLFLEADTTITVDGQQQLGTARATLEDSGTADRVAFRALAGLQVDLGPLHVFGQVNLIPKDLHVSVAAGVRITF